MWINLAVANSPVRIPVHPIPLQIKSQQNVFSYKVEIAFSSIHSMAGLMYRTDFPRNHAMLFRNMISDKSKNKYKIFMWMANTPLSLDMIFLDSEGIIVSIVENTIPFSTDIISSEVPAMFAIEVNAGEVSKKQIQIGQRVIHPVICGKCESDKE
ncbi:DUF192 domain-containing protein [Bartonella sp. F02]|uniref:DUF192 domain-containing protein n=1 Tax=Bartonella sp. F02 TaxID=2967262 RepID=UPI0022A90F48|nr:DUF192 domain-containing protein [Bartonella sp. F02]MCZ2328277.1 DUF192 domain-containing protein [Bartonella sp. F02]